LLKDNFNNLLKQGLVVLGGAVRMLKVLEDLMLSGQYLEHALHEAVMELLRVVLHDDIPIAMLIRGLAILASCIRGLPWLDLVVKALQPIVLLIRLVTLLKVVDDQMDALYKDALVQDPSLR
jgi:hypothetical protein